jgi:hypothetical protein
MKVYLLDTHRGPRYFLEEKSLISYLNNDKKRGEFIKGYNVTVLDAEVEKKENGSEFLENYETSTRQKNVRDLKLKSVLGDEFTTKVNKLINYIKEKAKDNNMRKDFLKEVELVTVEKKEFSKFVSKCSEYLLYQVCDKVEYYKLLLDVHNFRKINDRYTVYIYNQLGEVSNYASSMTPEKNKQNFLKAKQLNK